MGSFELTYWDNKEPQPGRLQRDYVTASNTVEIKRHKSALCLQQIGLGIISMISLVAIAMGFTAYRQSQEANRLQLEAQQERILAQTKTAEALFQSNRPLESLLESMKAGIEFQQLNLNNDPLKAHVITALQEAVFWVQENQRLGKHEGIVWTVRVSPDGKKIASASADGTVKIWQRDGMLMHKITSQNREPVLALAFSPDSQYLMTGGLVIEVQRDGQRLSKLAPGSAFHWCCMMGP